MIKTELVKRSPLRILEKSTHGGPKAGEIGVVASRKGVGKTACLVHIATDKLLQGHHVIHVSFAGRTDHIISWYEDIFREIARKRDLDNAMDIHDEVVKHRVIMNFSLDGVSVEQVLKSLRAMIQEGGFAADTIIVDGFDFQDDNTEEIQMIRQFAAELELTVWFSASLRGDDPLYNKEGVPFALESYLDLIDVLITMTPTREFVQLGLIKDHDRIVHEDLHLKLDSKSLLIAEE
ncbi:hypothetical protein [Salinispira pacifica]